MGALSFFIGDFGGLSGLFGRDFLRKTGKRRWEWSPIKSPKSHCRFFFRNFRFGIYFGIR